MRKIAILVLVISVLNAYSQDAHFTVFENSPAFFNPGSSGMLDQFDYRGTMITRNQWRKVVKPANSTALSVDLPLFRYSGSTPNKSFMGIGLTYAASGLGMTHTRQTNINLAISGVTTVGENKFLGLGLSIGKGGLRSDLTNATWSNQFDGYVYDASLPSNEAFEAKYKAAYLDLSAGLNYLVLARKSGQVTNIGVAYLHGNNPKLKKDPLLSGNIDPRIVFHLRSEINLKSKHTLPMFIIPRILFQNQGVHNDIQAGISLFVMTKQVSKITNFNQKEGIEAGFMMRYNDAIGIVAGYKTTNWRFGMSYDLTISPWADAVNRRGGTEISIIYYGINKSMRETRGIYLNQ